jgi:hypothetical protein
LALAKQESIFLDTSEPLIFYQNASPSKELRDASNEAEVVFRDYGIEASMRLDIYVAKLAAQENIKTSGQKLSSEEERLVEKMILDGARNGLGLPEKERDELTKLQKELSQACVEFMVILHLLIAFVALTAFSMQKNFNEENVSISKRIVDEISRLFINRVPFLFPSKSSKACQRMCCLDILNVKMASKKCTTSRSKPQTFFPSSNSLKFQRPVAMHTKLSRIDLLSTSQSWLKPLTFAVRSLNC